MLDTLTEAFLGSSDYIKSIITFLISILPIVELRGAIPFGYALGLPLPLVVGISILGNLLPIPFIILFIRRIFEWLRTKSQKLNNFVCKLERRAMDKSDLVRRYAFWGLFVFVAIPLPGTGAWTGALIAALLEVRLKTAIPAIALGVLGAAVIMSILSFGIGELIPFLFN